MNTHELVVPKGNLIEIQGRETEVPDYSVSFRSHGKPGSITLEVRRDGLIPSSTFPHPVVEMVLDFGRHDGSDVITSIGTIDKFTHKDLPVGKKHQFHLHHVVYDPEDPTVWHTLGYTFASPDSNWEAQTTLITRYEGGARKFYDTGTDNCSTYLDKESISTPPTIDLRAVMRMYTNLDLTAEQIHANPLALPNL